MRTHLEIDAAARAGERACDQRVPPSPAAGSRSTPRSRATRSPRWSRRSTRRIPKVQVSLYRSGTTEVMNRLQAEFAAGRPQADVVLVADAVATTQLKNDGRLLTYAERAGRQGAGRADRSRQDLLRHQADHHRHRLSTPSSSSAPPTSWNDLLAAAVAAKTIMAHPLYSGAAVIHVGTMVQQKDFGWRYFETLAQGGAIAAKGNGAVIEAVARGEKAYGVIIEYMAFNAQVRRARRSTSCSRRRASPRSPSRSRSSRPRGTSRPPRPSSTGSCRRRRSTSRSSQGYFPIFDGVAPPKGYPPVSSLQDHERRSARHPREGRGEQEAVHRAVRR